MGLLVSSLPGIFLQSQGRAQHHFSVKGTMPASGELKRQKGRAATEHKAPFPAVPRVPRDGPTIAPDASPSRAERSIVATAGRLRAGRPRYRPVVPPGTSLPATVDDRETNRGQTSVATTPPEESSAPPCPHPIAMMASSHCLRGSAPAMPSDLEDVGGAVWRRPVPQSGTEDPGRHVEPHEPSTPILGGRHHRCGSGSHPVS